MWIDIDDDYDGLPDAAFTDDELAAGVQHIMRTGNPNATSSGRSPMDWSHEQVDEEYIDSAEHQYSEAPRRFATFAEACTWAKNNPGRSFTRAVDGHGFETKPERHKQSNIPTQSAFDIHRKRFAEIRSLAPHLHEVLSKSASNRYRIFMKPFHRNIWEGELSRLSISQLSRLQLLISYEIEYSHQRLKNLYAEMRRFRSMKPGYYGEALTENLIQIMEGALRDINKCLAANRGINRPLKKSESGQKVTISGVPYHLPHLKNRF